jgi:hypothetical protein
VKLAAQFLSAAFFAVLFALCVFAFIAAIFLIVDWLTGQQFSPRGAGWGIMIISGAVAGWKVGYQVPNHTDLIAEMFKWSTESKIGRAIIVVSGVWISSWSLYCLYNVYPTDSYCYSDCGWGEKEWTFYIAGLFGVPIAALIAYLLFLWVKSGK